MKLPVPEKIETERVSLSRLRREDAEEIFYSYASKPEATRFMLWPTHRNLDDTRGFLNRAAYGWNAGSDYSFAIRLKDNQRLIGGCGFTHEDGRLQFGYVLSPTHWGRGLATEVCIRLMEVAKGLPGIYRISTFVDTDNIASAKVLRKSGLVEEARLEQWLRFVNQDNHPKDCLLFRLPL
jgi:ribosomal-protein-alanine N-acetyltransferase